MLNKIDWVFLRRPLMIFTVLVVLALVFLIAGNEYKSAANEEFTTAKSGLNSSHRKLRNQASEVALIDEYLREYKRLANEGFIGAERRLSWIESMKATNKDLKLPSFKYSIQVQDEYNRPGIKTSKTVRSVSSAMKLDLGLLHEEDLFKALDLIDDNVKSMFTVDSCSLLAEKSNGELKVDQQNLRVSCDLQWVSLQVGKQ